MPEGHLPAQVRIDVRFRASPLSQAFEDFMLSRRAMRCRPATLTHYEQTAGRFLEWLARENVTAPAEIPLAHVRAFLAKDADRLKDTSLHAHARGIRTLLHFWHAEGLIPAMIRFAMPRLERRRLPCLDAGGLKRVLAACDTPRDKALVMLLVDSGIRR